MSRRMLMSDSEIVEIKANELKAECLKFDVF